MFISVDLKGYRTKALEFCRFHPYEYIVTDLLDPEPVRIEEERAQNHFHRWCDDQRYTRDVTQRFSLHPTLIVIDDGNDGMWTKSSRSEYSDHHHHPKDSH